jgi:carotenoid cleavage dioxygenase-like enzyme
MKVSRRDFSKMLLGAGALGLLDLNIYGRFLGDSKRSMRYLATQNASGEGVWKNLKIEGKVPKTLNGNLFRTAPGQSSNHGVKLRHLFDGDAYGAAWRFKDGEVTLQGRYIPTPGRLEELKAGKMLYGTYGTKAPPNSKQNQGKNQPSVNIIEWRGKLLGLSEGGLPTIIDPDTFDFEGYENFCGVVPDYLTFTAHPRIDESKGEMFAWGFEKRPPGTMNIIKANRRTGEAETLYKMPQRGFNMVHDAMLTENYFVILILPTFYDMQLVMSGTPMGDALKFAEKQPTFAYAFPRDNQNGKAEPIAVELPPNIVFHYGNSYETKPNRITFEMIASDDKQILEALRTWRDDKVPELPNPPRLKQVTIDLGKKLVVSTKDLAEDVEFPRYDMRLTGKKSRYLYVAEKLYDRDASIIRVDLEKGTTQKAKMGKTRTVAEPVFVPKTKKINEDRGWILAQGYDADKNENFLEIRDAQTLDFAARVWANGQHFPLGFHGNYYSS